MAARARLSAQSNQSAYRALGDGVDVVEGHAGVIAHSQEARCRAASGSQVLEALFGPHPYVGGRLFGD